MSKRPRFWRVVLCFVFFYSRVLRQVHVLPGKTSRGPYNSRTITSSRVMIRRVRGVFPPRSNLPTPHVHNILNYNMQIIIVIHYVN